MGRIKELMIEQEEEVMSTGLSGNLTKGEKFVCKEAVTDVYAQKYIVKNGHPGICSYTSKHTTVIDLIDLTYWIVNKIRKYFHNPDDDGLYLESTFFDNDEEDDPNSPLQRINGYVTRRNALYFDSTIELLYYFDFSDNEDLVYDIDKIIYNSNWINQDSFIPRKDEDLSFYWEQFAQKVKSTGSYVPSTIKDLAAIMSGEKERPHDMILEDIESILSENECKTTIPAGTTLYRCRNVNDRSEIVDKFMDLTSAPATNAVANRMSKAGVSMFYAAFKKKVSLEEAVDKGKSLQALGTFKTKIPLVVVNLTNLPMPSIWAETDLWGLSFLHEFTQKISENFDDYSPREKEISYIPTQVFTEYIKKMSIHYSNLHYDGLMYYSSKVPGEKNIVLFANRETSVAYVEIEDVEYSPMPI